MLSCAKYALATSLCVQVANRIRDELLFFFSFHLIFNLKNIRLHCEKVFSLCKHLLVVQLKRQLGFDHSMCCLLCFVQ